MAVNGFKLFSRNIVYTIWVWEANIWKAFTMRFVLDVRKSRKF